LEHPWNPLLECRCDNFAMLRSLGGETLTKPSDGDLHVCLTGALHRRDHFMGGWLVLPIIFATRWSRIWARPAERNFRLPPFAVNARSSYRKPLRPATQTAGGGGLVRPRLGQLIYDQAHLIVIADRLNGWESRRTSFSGGLSRLARTRRRVRYHQLVEDFRLPLRRDRPKT
jgi:hypothetical protein